MIVGFNTDVKRGETVYHVQSEVRQRARLLHTEVFVGGRCLGKRVFAFGDGFEEEQIQEALKAQHRIVLEAVREGNLSDVVVPPAPPGGA
jgi:hypothetical protein